MYGLLLENLATFIRAQWGEGKWESVRRQAGIDMVAFSIHHVYPETLLRRLSRSALQILGVDERQFFEDMGVYFVQYVSQYGYDQLLTVLGRHMRDFLNGLDNLHEYLKFSYPKMRAPSFYCDDETESGLKLHYRSKRRGFVYYVMGQIKQVANQFYNQDCEIRLLKEEVVGETVHVVFQLNFDNSAFTEAESIKSLIGKDLRLPFSASTLFELFPFCIVFNSEMEITHTGHTLMTILKDLVGQIMTEAFDMSRPLIPFCFPAIMQRRNNIFELVTVAPIHDVNTGFGKTENFDVDMEGTRLWLRGQMLYMEDWNMMLYLANPVMPELTSLVEAGLFINDLSLHDCSRDLVLAGTQQSVELKLALDQEQQKSRKLGHSMKKLDEEMRRTDELLYQMIPKQVADRIRRGENPVNACQSFESVSILFSDVVQFTEICTKIPPLQAIALLNHMYFLFDQLTERNGVYKVESLGYSYMVVSGAPNTDLRHAERVSDMALDMIDAAEAIEDPCQSQEQRGLKLRIGCHSGPVVAGIVGVKLPRYSLFGDTVVTACRLEAAGEPARIQISDACRNLLPPSYRLEVRGTIPVKGKGSMNTYWLKGREARVPLSKYFSKSLIWAAPSPNTLQGIRRPTSPTIPTDAGAADAGMHRIGGQDEFYSTRLNSWQGTVSRKNLLRRFNTKVAGPSSTNSSFSYGPIDAKQWPPSILPGNYCLNKKQHEEGDHFGNENPSPAEYGDLILDSAISTGDLIEDILDSPADPEGADSGLSGSSSEIHEIGRLKSRRHHMLFVHDCLRRISSVDNSEGPTGRKKACEFKRSCSFDTEGSPLTNLEGMYPASSSETSKSCSLS